MIKLQSGLVGLAIEKLPGHSVTMETMHRQIYHPVVIGEEEIFDNLRPDPLPPFEVSRRTAGIEPLSVSHVQDFLSSIENADPVTAHDGDPKKRFGALVYLSEGFKDHPELRAKGGCPGEVDHAIFSVDSLLAERESDVYRREDNERHAHIRVDLDALETVTIKEFKRWLKAEKRVRGLRRAGGTVRLAEWYRDRVLPYVDLDLWARAHGIVWSPSELADLLYPEDDDRRGEKNIEALRKTAEIVTSRRMAGRLAAEAMRESG